MYAIIRACGKQYRVAVGDVIEIDRLPQDAGNEIRFEEVLMLGNDTGHTVGQPLVEAAAVVGEVIDHTRGEKIVIFKHKKRKNYKRTTGHRQDLTRVKIKEIAGH